MNRKVNLDEYLVYDRCPWRYNLVVASGHKSDDRGDKLQALAERAVTALGNYYFSQIILDKDPSINFLLNNWERLWFKDVDIADIITGTVPVTHNSFIRVNTGVVLGLKAFKEYWRDTYVPIAINEKVNISGACAFLPITIPLVNKEKSTGKLEITVISSFGNIKRVTVGKKRKELSLIQAAVEESTGEKLPLRIYTLTSPRTEPKVKTIEPDNDILKETKKRLETIHNDTDFTASLKCSGCREAVDCTRRHDATTKK
jgi:hypothetical protein